MRSIIVGTDFSKGSYVAIEVATDIANKMHCDIKIVWAKREKLLMDEEQQTVMNMLPATRFRLSTIQNLYRRIQTGCLQAYLQMTAYRELTQKSVMNSTA